ETLCNMLKLRFVTPGPGDLRSTVGPEDILHYAYAVFHAPSYRRRYAEFLKYDFPRLPLTSDLELFRALCAEGQELVRLHLLLKEAPATGTFRVAGDNEVRRVHYAEPAHAEGAGRVWINATQYFAGVPANVWQFRIGGYPVCGKWLKDRKGCRLSA